MSTETKLRHGDGTAHFSQLKAMALSPLHYKHACETPFEATLSMRVGTIVHAMVLGSRPAYPVVKYWNTDGDGNVTALERKGNAWKEFKAAQHPDATIVTLPEWERSEPIATAVLTDPVAGPLIRGARHEVPLAWEDAGIQCSTGGIDVVGDGFICDLKTSRTTHPEAFQKICERMHYHSQMAWLENGAKLNGIDTSKGVYLIGVENTAPHAVTVLRLSPATLALGRKSVAMWLERLRGCEASNHWPGFQQCAVDFDLEGGTWDLPDDDEDDDTAEEHAA